MFKALSCYFWFFLGLFLLLLHKFLACIQPFIRSSSQHVTVYFYLSFYVGVSCFFLSMFVYLYAWECICLFIDLCKCKHLYCCYLHTWSFLLSFCFIYLILLFSFPLFYFVSCCYWVRPDLLLLLIFLIFLRCFLSMS